jgi:hypothetical protein
MTYHVKFGEGVILFRLKAKEGKVILVYRQEDSPFIRRREMPHYTESPLN